MDERERRWTEILATDAGRSTRLVATDDDGRVIGFVSSGPASTDEDVPAAPEGAGEVYAIYLREGVRGRGVGRELFARAMHALRANGFAHAVLWVLESNDLARRFYEAAGWTWDGTRSHHRFDCGARPILRYSRRL